MSTGKRLAKRSILGTRVACSLDDGKYYPAVIVDVRSRSPEDVRPSIYSVRVEGERRVREVSEHELVGSGFSPVSAVKLRAGQKVYITHNNREVCAAVLQHTPERDEVLVAISATESGGSPSDARKRLEEVRLLESRKSARLADQDTDFAKLADVATDRKRPPGGPSSGRSSPQCGAVGGGQSSYIDVPGGSAPIPMGSRKRRSSRCGGGQGGEEDTMDECAAAVLLMKLSCSPRSTLLSEGGFCPDSASMTGGGGGLPPTVGSSSTTSSGVWSWTPSSRSPPAARSATPSPPLSDPSPSSTDDGIDLDDSFLDEAGPRKRRSSTRTMFQCTWDACRELAESCSAIESHIRSSHLGRSDHRRSRSLSSLHSLSESDSEDDHEEEFYWTEVEVNVATSVDPATAAGLVSGSRSTRTAIVHGGGGGGPASTPSSPQVIAHTTVTTGHRQGQAGAGTIITTSISSSNPQQMINNKSSSGSNTNGSLLPTSPSAAASTLLTLSSSSPSSSSFPSSHPVKVVQHSNSTNTALHHNSYHHQQQQQQHHKQQQQLGHYSQYSSNCARPQPQQQQQQRHQLQQHSYGSGQGGSSSPVSVATSQYVQVSPPPTLSHMDMARPPHEDPEYRRQQGLNTPVLSSSWPRPSNYMLLNNSTTTISSSGVGGGKVRVTTTSPKSSPGRTGSKRGGDSKKCRKFYGMDQRESWCTQCKWKKACTRFGGNEN